MSGGVDSTVSAFLLKKNGFRVTGVFLDLGLEVSKKSQREAKKACRILNIPLMIVTAEREFKRRIIDYFLKEYALGKTPNPCVFCNREIKFKLLFEIMTKKNFDFIATGHYARLEKGTKLLPAKDEKKDQAYFLYGLKKTWLPRIIFPLGNFSKPQVKNIAKKLGLLAQKEKESQDVCFVEKGRLAEFLKKNLTLREGDIIDEERKKIGSHKGLSLYTLGQRKGLKIGGKGPYYVFGKKLRTNELQATNQKNYPGLYSQKIEITGENWLSFPKNFPTQVWIQTRYRIPKFRAIIKRKKSHLEAFFLQSQWAVAPGQASVFYGSSGEVLGGGIISKVKNKNH